MLLLYNSALLPLRAGAAVWAAWRGLDPARALEVRERRARAVPSVRPGGVWIHGASVGESRLVRALAGALRSRRPDLPLCASAVTRTGRSQLPEAPEVDASFFLPLDFSGFPARLLDAIRPSALVLVETELWPNLLHESTARDVSVILVNARLSSEKMSRYRRLSGLYAPLLRRVSRVGARSREDADRFLELGALPERVSVTGDIKYDLDPPAADEAELKDRFGLDVSRPVFVAGSTGAGEDAPVLDGVVEARRSVPSLFLVLAPRHPERADEAFAEAQRRGLRLHRLSAGEDTSAGGHDGILVDTVGELRQLYAMARVAFVGGSLVPVGGHNLLEPAALGVPVLFGPHTLSVADSADDLVAAGGGARVEDPVSLARSVVELVEDDARHRVMSAAARELVQRNRGALEQSADLVFERVRATT